MLLITEQDIKRTEHLETACLHTEFQMLPSVNFCPFFSYSCLVTNTTRVQYVGHLSIFLADAEFFSFLFLFLSVLEKNLMFSIILFLSLSLFEYVYKAF